MKKQNCRVGKRNYKKTKEKIKRLAEEFGLRYDSKAFVVRVIPKKDFVKMLYIFGCPLDPYMKFGKTRKERVKNYKAFISSEEFQKEAKRASGTVIEKKYFDIIMKNIKDAKVKKEFKRMVKKLNLKKSIPLAVVTKASNEKESRFLFEHVLFHEWIHTLLRYNKADIKRDKDITISENYEEGLVSYMQIFLTSKNKNFGPHIKATLRKIKADLKAKGDKLDAYHKDVFEKMLFWDDVLKNKKTTKARRKAIEAVIRKLRKCTQSITLSTSTM